MIYIDDLRKMVGTRTLFSIDKLTINDNDRIGLIGNNGAGKTTFLKVLSYLDMDFSGNVDVKMQMNYLLNDYSDEFHAVDEVDSKAKQSYENMYSPGEYQRLKLSNLLSNNSSFILIDEPTSHLDIEQKEKLIESLKKRYKGFILISHDRDFINQTCNKIFELDNGKLEIYTGDYTFYVEEKVRRKKFAKREYENYISEKKRLSSVASDIAKQSSKVRTTPKRMGNSEARLHKMGGQMNKKKLDHQVKAIESRINQLDVKEKPKEEKPIALTISEKDKIYSKILIRSENLNKSFGDKTIFSKAKLEIENNNKVALIGANGSGKTTLFNMIPKGEIWVHPKLKIGYYSQMDEMLKFATTILDNVLESSIYDQTMTRIILARLGFRNDDVFKPIAILSDGEKAKVKLAKLLTSDFNYLILDEPTNFLDIRAIEALEELLKGYDRPLLFVTHDVSFINNVSDSLLMIENHEISSFKGNLDQYKQRKMQSATESKQDEFLIDFRLSSITNRLAMEISKDERAELESEYARLLEHKNKK